MFSATFRYALISLLDIADAADGVNTVTIAQRHGIPGTYLAKVLGDLLRLGFIVSLKGRRGGYRLAKPAEQIDLLAMQRCLAGSVGSEGPTSSVVVGAELWLQTIEQRWQQELATTTLLDVQRFVESQRSQV